MQQKSHMVDLLFALALFCVFAASSLIVVIIGADVYSRTASGMESNYGLNTSLCYVTEKVRQHDEPGAVSLGEFGGTQALLLDETFEGEVYRTYIYYYDGALREIYTSAANPVAPEEGQPVMELQGFFMRQESGMLEFEAVGQDGARTKTAVALRCDL